MSPEWINAIAAAVQAIGSIAAIWVAVGLARASAKREIAVQLAAEKRAAEADRLAQERTDNALRELEYQNVDPLIMAASKLVKVLNFEVASSEKYRGVLHTVYGSHRSEALDELRALLTDALKKPGRAEYLHAIDTLLRACQPWSPDASQNGDAFVNALSGYRLGVITSARPLTLHGSPAARRYFEDTLPQ